MNFESELVAVNDLKLDLENPRFDTLGIAGAAPNNEKSLEKLYSKNSQFITLKDSLVKFGVMDPIWVQKEENPRFDTLRIGKYLVVEGNLRVACLRSFLNEDRIPPQGVSYELVNANIIDSSFDVKKLKERLNEGKYNGLMLEDVSN